MQFQITIPNYIKYCPGMELFFAIRVARQMFLLPENFATVTSRTRLLFLAPVTAQS